MKTKKLLVAVLVAATLVCLLAFAALEVGAADAVSYMDKDGTVKSVTDYSAVTSSTTTLTAGFWVVKGTVTVSSRITVSGNVHLILADGARLVASRGIQLTAGNALTVYASDTLYEEGQGELVANVKGDDSTYGGHFVIGSSTTMGSLTVNGGYVYASHAERFGAGAIGGVQSAGSIEINGGYVYAFHTQGNDASTAIGTHSDTDGGTLTVNGGHFFTGAGLRGNAIGGASLQFTINGGTVYAGGATDGTVPVASDVELNGGFFYPKPSSAGEELVAGTVKDKNGTEYSFLGIDMPYPRGEDRDRTPVLAIEGTGLGTLPINGGALVFTATTNYNTVGFWYPSDQSPKVTKVVLGNGDEFEADLTPTSGGVSGVFYLSYSLPADTFGNAVENTMTPTRTTVGRIVLPQPSTVPAHHSFNGWRIGNTTYKAGEEVTLTADATAVARWKVDQHTLTFRYLNAVTGEKLVKDEKYTYNYGEKYDLPLPFVEGYEPPKGMWRGTVTETATFTAEYKPRTILELEGGTLAEGEKRFHYAEKQEGFFASFPIPTKEGYVFSHWADENGTAVDGNLDFSVPHRLYANYVEADFIVTADTAGGYTYTTDGVLTITKAGRYEISLSEGIPSTAHLIRIAADIDGEVTVVLDGVKIVPDRVDVSALSVWSDAQVVILGDCHLAGGVISAAIGGNANVTLSGTGTLTLVAGRSATVAGWGYSAPACSIGLTVEGITLLATGGDACEATDAEYVGADGMPAIAGNVTLRGGAKLLATGGAQSDGTRAPAVLGELLGKNLRTKAGADSATAAYKRYDGEGYVETDFAQKGLAASGTEGVDYRWDQKEDGSYVLTLLQSGVTVRMAEGVVETDNLIAVESEEGKFALLIDSLRIVAPEASAAITCAKDLRVTLIGDSYFAAPVVFGTAADGFITLMGNGTLHEAGGIPVSAGALLGTEVEYALLVRQGADKAEAMLAEYTLSSGGSYGGSPYDIFSVGGIILYTDGERQENLFADQMSYHPLGDAVPAFEGTPVREGYRFLGWSEPIPQTVSGNLILKALWEEKETLSLDLTTQTTVYEGVVQTFSLLGDVTDGFTVTYTNENGDAVSDPLGAGAYTVTITRPEDDTYKKYQETATFVIEKADVELMLEIPQYAISPSQQMDIRLWAEGFRLPVTLTVQVGDGTPEVTERETGIHRLVCPDVPLGEKILIKVEFLGNADLNPAGASVEILVGQIDHTEEIRAVEEKLEELESALLDYYTKAETDAMIDAIESLVGTLPAGTSAETVVEYIDEVKTALTDLVGTLPAGTSAETVVEYIDSVGKALSDLIGELPADATAETVVEYIDSVGQALSDLIGELPADATAETVVEYVTEVKDALSALVGELPEGTSAETVVEYIDSVGQALSDLIGELPADATAETVVEYIDSVGKALSDLIGELPADANAETVVEYITEVKDALSSLIGELPADATAETVVEYVTEVKDALSALVGELPADTTAETVVEYIDSVGKALSDLIGELPADANAETVVEYITEVKNALAGLIGELPADANAETVVEYVDSVGKALSDLIGEFPADATAETVVEYIDSVGKALSDLIGELPADATAETVVEYIDSVGKALSDLIGELPADANAETVVEYITEVKDALSALVGELPDDTSAETVVEYIDSVGKALSDLIGELPADANAETVVEYITEVKDALSSLIGELPADATAETVVEYITEVKDALSALVGELPDDTSAETVVEYIDSVGKALSDLIGELPADATAETVVEYVTEVKDALAGLIGELPEGTSAETVVEYITEVKGALSALVGELPEGTSAETVVEYIDSVGKALSDLIGELPADATAETVVEYVTEVKDALSALVGELPDGTSAETIVEYIDSVGKALSDLIGELPADANAADVVTYIGNVQAALKARIDSLESALADANQKLDAKVEMLGGADADNQTFTTVACVLGGVSVAGNIALFAWFLIRHKKGLPL